MATRLMNRHYSVACRLGLTRTHFSTAPVAQAWQRTAPFSTTSTVRRNDGGGQSDKNFTAVATGGYEYPGIPQFADPYAKRQWQLEHMAGAFRVFARMGFTEGASGHISVRDTVDPDTFWINPYVTQRQCV